MDLGGQVRHGEDIPIPLSAQFTGALSPAVMQDTAAKLKLLASGNGAGTPMTPADTKGKPMRYRECQKNHAAGIGGHALDGCGEFLPCGEDPIESLKCAACGCHRNFHRIEIEGESPCQLCIHRKERKRSLMLTSPDHDEGQYLGSPSSSMKKRFRTKFTGDQKERMLSFADKLGWKIQKHDEAEVQQFCNEVGVKRHVLKVWMHNNKHTLGKKI